MKQPMQNLDAIPSHEVLAALNRLADFRLKMELAALFPDETPTIEELEQHVIDYEFLVELEDCLF